MAEIQYWGNVRISPRWAGDFGKRDSILPQPGKLDPSQFTDSAGVPITVTASAAAAATSISVSAMAPSTLANTVLIAAGNILIPNGTVISFGPTGSGKFAQLSADVHVGDTALSVWPIPVALVGNETADYSKYGAKFIPSGTLLGRNNTQRNSSGLYVPASIDMDEIYLMMFDIPDATLYNDCEFYRHHWLVKENYLPNYAAMAADIGVPSPQVAPTVSVGGTDGTVGAGQYFVGYTFITAAGETQISPLAAITKTTTQHLTVASIAFPTGATGINFYCSTAPNSGEIGFSKTLGAASATNLTADGTVAHTPPSVNGTVGFWGTQLQIIRSLYTTIEGYN